MMRRIFLLLILLPFSLLAQKEYSEKAKSIFQNANEVKNSGDNSAAYLLYENCISIEPRYVEAYVNMSAIKFEAKSFEKALDLARKAYKIEKVQHSIFSVLGKAYYANSFYDSSAFFLERIKFFGDLTLQEKYFLASSNVKIGNYSDAKKSAMELSEDYPNNSDFNVLYGNVLYGFGEYENAMISYEKALALDANNTYIYSNIAKANLELGNQEKALALIDKGIESTEGSDRVAFLILKGNYYYSVDELDNAEKAYNDAYVINSNDPSILVNQAGVFIARDDYQSALDKCNMAIGMNDQLMEAYYNRGIANEMLRNISEACEDWEQAFILGSEKAEAFLNSPTCNE